MAIAPMAESGVERVMERLDVCEQLVKQQQLEIAALKRAASGSASVTVDRIERATSRRGLLKAAGASLVGVVAASALDAKPAFATQGSAIIAGSINTETLTTEVDVTGTTGNVTAFSVTGSGTGHGIQAYGGASGSGVSAAGGGSASGVEAYGGGSDGTGVLAFGGSPNGTAVNATGTGIGTGVVGSASAGAGVAGSSSTGAGVAGISSSGPGGSFSAGRAQVYFSPATTAGPPTTGHHYTGDLWVDSAGVCWMCISGNGTTLGSFAPLLQGGLNNALFTAVSTQQYTLANSNGLTWVDLDGTNLKITITPSFNCQAILSGNSDLWTSTAGFNQDLGISISGGAYPTVAGQPEAWKESGGFAGTFSPNAAFVETVKPLMAGTTYTIKLQWKANKNAPGATIWAGAGPIPLGSSTFSPTRLTALLIISQ